MRRNIRKLMLVILMMCASFYISGCGEYVSQTDYDQLLAENQRLSMELEAERETVDAKLTGSFVATVRLLIPDYVLDNTTPQIAILTEFQTGPYTLWLGEETAAQLKVGETYCFVIEDTPIGEIPREEFEKRYYYIGRDPHRSFDIRTIRAPEEGERGLNSPHISYEENDL